MVKNKVSDVALVVQELEKARAALTVLYEQSSKDQQSLAAKLAQISQRCKASESRLKRLENTMQGDAVNAGILTQLWDIKQKLDVLDTQRTSNSKLSFPRISLNPSSSNSNRPPASMTVHPLWIQVVLPSLVFVVAALIGICIWLAS